MATERVVTKEGLRQREEIVAAFKSIVTVAQETQSQSGLLEWLQGLSASEFCAVTGLVAIVVDEWAPVFALAITGRNTAELERELAQRAAECAARSRDDEPLAVEDN